MSRPLIDKFFPLGGLGGLIGMGVFGFLLLLERHNIISFSSYYPNARHTHAALQLYLFFLPFIGGFMLQSAPKILSTGTPPSPIGLALIPTSIAGIATLPFYPPVGVVILSLGGAALLMALLKDIYKTDLLTFFRAYIYCICSSLCFAVGWLFDFSSPQQLALFIWLGVVGVVFATAQQFMVGVLGGQRPTPKATILNLFLFTIAAIALATPGAALRFAPLASCVCYLWSIDLWSALRRQQDYFGVTFLSALLWLPIGAAIFAFYPGFYDQTIHAWGLGTGTTLIGAISMRLIGWGRMDLPDANKSSKTPYCLAIWNFFVTTRVILGIVDVPRGVLVVLAVGGVALIGSWALWTIKTSVNKLRTYSILKSSH